MQLSVEAKIGDQSEIFILFKEKIIFESGLIKSNRIIQRKNRVDTYGAPLFT